MNYNVTNQTHIHEEVKSKLNLGNACYNSVQNILSLRRALVPKIRARGAIACFYFHFFMSWCLI
jgi:hypothetical protein